MTGDIRTWISGRLDPLVETPQTGLASDYDLAPDMPGQDDPPTLAAVLVALVERTGGYNVILTKRSNTLRRHKGQVALPGGRCDPGETPWTTALREAEEEIGLARGLVTLAGLSTPYRTGTGYLVTPVVGFVAPGFTLTPNPDEVAEIFETPFAFLMDPENHKEQEHTFADGQTRRFYAMTHEDRVIWGATAGILRELYRRLYGAVVA
jgi:8-oxo-dGTP pyrophosphatase MutT (NUDIX family)